MLALRNRSVRRWGLFAFASLVTILINLPVLMMVLNSFQSTQEILMSRNLWPSSFSLDNYFYVSNRTAFWNYFGSSALVSIIATAGTVVAAALAGYSLSRFRSIVLSAYSRGLLMVQMFPIILALIPLFIIFRNLHLLNTYASVILIYAVVHLPFATWMFKAFFDGIPRDLEEAALVDGCTKMQGFVRIVLPLSGPGIAAVSIFAFLFSYNEFFIANVFLRDEDLLTIPVGIQAFMQQYGTDWGSLLAASTLAMLPTFVLFLFIQRYMIHGALAGGVKG